MTGIIENAGGIAVVNNCSPSPINGQDEFESTVPMIAAQHPQAEAVKKLLLETSIGRSLGPMIGIVTAVLDQVNVRREKDVFFGASNRGDV